jgi:hypothetical protein
MTYDEMLLNLHKAQDLLSDVYHASCKDKALRNIEGAMSCADSCIIESIEDIESMLVMNEEMNNE